MKNKTSLSPFHEKIQNQVLQGVYKKPPDYSRIFWLWACGIEGVSDGYYVCRAVSESVYDSYFVINFGMCVLCL